MLGNLIQYLLYAMLWVTVMLIVTSALAVRQARRGADVNLERYFGGLSLMAGCAPYVGLFGTVWHIITALLAIGSGNLNVAMIAQPIGQALYATLWGLGCAIPALVAHRVLLMFMPAADTDAAQGNVAASEV